MNTERKIVRGVRINKTVYVPGKEDELNKALSGLSDSKAEVARLSRKGYIQGTWGKAKEAAKE